MIIIVSCVFFVLSVFLIICSHKEEVELIGNKAIINKIFLKMATYLYKKDLITVKKNTFYRRYIHKAFHSKRVSDDLKSLYPTESADYLESRFYINKLSEALLLLFVGNVIALYIALSSLASNRLVNGTYIVRNTYGAGNKLVGLIASVEDKEEVVKIDVEERHYSEKEIEAMMKSITKELDTKILGNNDSLSKVVDDLNLVKEVEPYPATISWEFDNYKYIDQNGKIRDVEIGEEGELVLLTATIAYFENVQSYSFYIHIFPKLLSEEDQFRKNLISMVTKSAKSKIEEEKWYLPDTIDGRTIEWKEQKEKKGISLIILIFIASGMIFFIKDRDLHNKVENRKKELLMDYPEIINKLSLLLGAGLTMRNAWKKITFDYKKKREDGKKKRFAYEEMLIAYHEMESGISEGKAYDNFGKRCRVQQYIKFAALLNQNLKKGSNMIIMLLDTEAKDAFEERKSLAKQLGEEAGTKLLFPMLIMLTIVMIVIIVPAFLSFQI